MVGVVFLAVLASSRCRGSQNARHLRSSWPERSGDARRRPIGSGRGQRPTNPRDGARGISASCRCASQRGDSRQSTAKSGRSEREAHNKHKALVSRIRRRQRVPTRGGRKGRCGLPDRRGKLRRRGSAQTALSRASSSFCLHRPMFSWRAEPSSLHDAGAAQRQQFQRMRHFKERAEAEVRAEFVSHLRFRVVFEDGRRPPR